MKDITQKYEDVEKSLKHIKEKHETLYNAYESFGKLMHNDGGTLDEQSRAIVKVALSAANKTPHTLRSHIYKALEAGCNVNDIEHAIFLTITTVGFPSMLEAYLVFRDVIDENAPANNVVLENIICH